jgi:hypothetical protein
MAESASPYYLTLETEEQKKALARPEADIGTPVGTIP